MVSFHPLTVTESFRIPVVSPALGSFHRWTVTESCRIPVVSPAMSSFHPWLVTESCRTSVVSQCYSLTQTTCRSLSQTLFSSFTDNMMQTPAQVSEGQTFRWPAMSPDASEDLRGMKVWEWTQEAWNHPDKQGSKWKTIPPQPSAPHVHDEPLTAWFAQRGLNWRPGLGPDDVWYEPHHTFTDEGMELIVFTKLPRSPEKVKRVRDARKHMSSERIVYHGTVPYAAANIARNEFLASDDEERGHQSLGTEEGKLTGVYVTPVEDTAFVYAVPQILFRDYDVPEDNQYWTRFVFEVIVDVDKRKGKNKPGHNKKNIQWVFAEDCVEVVSLRIYTNFSPGHGDGRIRSWRPELELTPNKDIFWNQIKKLNGRWITSSIKIAPSPPSAPQTIRKNYWIFNDSLKKYPCNRCN